MKVICLRGSGSFLSDDLQTARVQGTSTCRVVQEFAPLFPTVTAVHHMAGKYVQYVLLLSVEIMHSSLARPTLLHQLEQLSIKSIFICFSKPKSSRTHFIRIFCFQGYFSCSLQIVQLKAKNLPIISLSSE